MDPFIVLFKPMCGFYTKRLCDIKAITQIGDARVESAGFLASFQASFLVSFLASLLVLFTGTLF